MQIFRAGIKTKKLSKSEGKGRFFIRVEDQLFVMASKQARRSLEESSVSSGSQTQWGMSDFNAQDKKKLVADVVFYIMTQVQNY